MKAQVKQTPTKSAVESKPVIIVEDPELIYRACKESVESADMMHWHLLELSSLFESIRALDDNEFSTVARLAELGKYLCSDWANLSDCAAADLKHHVNVLHSMLYTQGEKHV